MVAQPSSAGSPMRAFRMHGIGEASMGVVADPTLSPGDLLVEPVDAVFVEPFACGLHFVDKAHLGPGTTAVVLGAGPAGLLTLQAAALAGVNVIVSEPYEPRRKLALALGAHAVVEPGDLADA